MKNYIIIALAAVFFIEPALAEQAAQDLYATVTVNKSFGLILDNPMIDFGYVDPGKSVELNPSSKYNEVKCVSNKGDAWYLKLSITADVIGPDGKAVPADMFKWQIFNIAGGDGSAAAGWHSFSKTPELAYTSGRNDMAGGEVMIRFKYKLDLPRNAQGGNYRVRVLYTMTDNPI